MSETKLISVNVGLPREVISHKKSVRTGIFKRPVAGRVQVRTLNLEGDRQADLTVHGGPEKAVYAYPSEHYSILAHTIPGYGDRMGNVRRKLHATGFSGTGCTHRR